MTFRIDGGDDALTAVVSGRDPEWPDADHGGRIPGPMRLSARWTREVSSVDVVLGEDGPARITAHAETMKPLDLRHPGDAIAKLDQQPMRGSVAFAVADLASFERFIPDVEQLSGSASAHLDFEGTVSQPRLTGEATRAPCCCASRRTRRGSTRRLDSGSRIAP